jgi:hypothetical protein
MLRRDERNAVSAVAILRHPAGSDPRSICTIIRSQPCRLTKSSLPRSYSAKSLTLLIGRSPKVRHGLTFETTQHIAIFLSILTRPWRR